MKKSYENHTLTITSLDEQGYGLARDKQFKFFILNALPNEIVEVEIHNKKHKNYFGNAVSIQNISENRIEPKEDHYTSCSPWQILKYEEQIKNKLEFLQKAFDAYKIRLPDIKLMPAEEQDRWNYRNKVEYGFYTNKETEETSLSFFKRGSHFGKVIVKECCLIHKNLDISAQKILKWVQAKGLGGFQLKTVLLRSSSTTGKVMATLFIKDETIKVDQSELDGILDDILIGFKVVFSNPLSPSSIVTTELATVGNLILTEKIGKLNLEFGIDNFFQVHVPQFQKVLKILQTELKKVVSDKFKLSGKDGAVRTDILAADLYSGVGTIGLSVLDLFAKVKMIELSPMSREITLRNAKNNNLDDSKLEIWEGATEKSLDALNGENVIIVDPPRSGLPFKVAEKLLEVSPEIIVYLSCNPFTQARDLAILIKQYNIHFQQAFDSYPQTPHIENLIILTKAERFNSNTSV